ncbi:hypothetical protein MCOR25_008584 [Pyricularia grisea]|uniref:RING-type domain-containing protein n=1 Tax=Pyricularia grisea TaxID=148305 RepID=A0A6P8BL23_PYRGI|nr:uncharacterized protein PgNI_00214 [Pyricularia grisea]KAI6354469.1 hypothetical protein MCOR25_008584 [Pyricularia grisea]TLD17389.1 hypothetical protein PgNI_00214 [Pyricularia grisea]
MPLLQLLPLLAVLTAAAVVSIPAQDALDVSAYPVQHLPRYQEESALTLAVSAPAGGPYLTFPIVPFTQETGLNASQSQRGMVHIEGQMIVATQQTYADLVYSNAVAYLCCDSLNNSNVTPEMMLRTIIENQPKAILLYTQQGNCCNVTGLGDRSLYQKVFTMIDATEASSTLNLSTSANGALQAVISGNSTRSDGDDTSQTGNNSAVAMSVLYSITGLITLLFLVIITIGAVRAHRYPERYGPRNAHGGRPRQSRAKGLARAVLDTLPIVKFGAPPPTEGKPDPTLELEDGGLEPGKRNMSANHVQAHHLSTIPEDAEAIPTGANSAMRESRIAPAQLYDAAAVAQGRTDPLDDEHLGCSICTEDFLVGEDVRVLPCDHKFHPACIDPWLINVSGTCPLCRLDLHPHKSTDEEDEGDSTQLPPPLGADPEFEVDTRGTNRDNRRSSRLFDIHRLRHASAEERIEVLRRYRRESQERPAANVNADDENSRTSRLTARLKEKFRVRTRAQPPGHRRPGPTSQGPGQIL